MTRIQVDNESLRALLTKVKDQTKLSFFFPNEVDNYMDLSFPLADRTLKEILDLALEGTDLNYRTNENSVFIFVDHKLKPDKQTKDDLRTHLSALNVTGKVVDGSSDQLLPGVNIIVKGTLRGTTTDAEGKFSIAVNEDEVLVFSFIGFKTYETQILGRTVIDVVMETDASVLNEVQIVGTTYWSSAKEKSTSSIVKVSSREIEKQPVTSPLLALQGRVAGLDITPSTGAPGAAPTIRIRGNNSLSPSGSYPLYIIDGIPIDSSPMQSVNSSTMSSGFDPLSTINPANIESIEVLKDGDATAIYGSRGANGVVIINTKKSESQASTNFEMGVYTGFGEVAHKIDVLDKDQYLAMRREAYKNDNEIPDIFTGYDLIQWDTTRSTDWQEVLLGKTARITDISSSISGGGKHTSFKLGGNYHSETPIFPGKDFGYRRINGQLSFNHRSADERFLLDLALNYGRDNQVLPTDNNLTVFAVTLPPIAPELYKADGSLNYEQTLGGRTTFSNPLGLLKKLAKSRKSFLIASATLSYKLIDNLFLKTRVGFTENNRDEVATVPIASLHPELRPTRFGSSTFAFAKRNSWIVEPQLTFNRRLGNHSVETLIGTTFQQSIDEQKQIAASGYTSDATLENLSSATSFVVSREDELEYKYAALFMRAAYDFKGRYLINLTGRRDGSSRFGPGKRFGNFGAIGAAWIFSEEPFLQNKSSFLTFGKIRTSYAITGNDQIGDYQFYNVYQNAAYNYQTGTSLSPRALYNPDYAWEITRKIEGALELGFFDNRISLEVNFYKNRSTNQLVQYKLPAITGFPFVLANFDATVENMGWEFMLNLVNVDKRRFKWTSSLNLTLPENKLIEFDGIENSSYAKTYQVGEPLSIRFLYTFTGVDPQTGDARLLDVNNDGEINNLDQSLMQPLGKKFYGGLNNVLQFGGFEIAFLFQFTKQFSGKFMDNIPGISRNQPVDVLDRWQNDGDVTDVAKFTQTFASQSNYQKLKKSSYNYDDASFIRLKTATLSFSLPAKLLERVRLGTAKVYLQGQNLFTITRYVSLDPESGVAMPPLRTVTMGIQLNLR